MLRQSRPLAQAHVLPALRGDLRRTTGTTVPSASRATATTRGASCAASDRAGAYTKSGCTSALGTKLTGAVNQIIRCCDQPTGSCGRYPALTCKWAAALDQADKEERHALVDFARNRVGCDVGCARPCRRHHPDQGHRGRQGQRAAQALPGLTNRELRAACLHGFSGAAFSSNRPARPTA